MAVVTVPDGPWWAIVYPLGGRVAFYFGDLRYALWLLKGGCSAPKCVIMPPPSPKVLSWCKSVDVCHHHSSTYSVHSLQRMKFMCPMGSVRILPDRPQMGTVGQGWASILRWAAKVPTLDFAGGNGRAHHFGSPRPRLRSLPGESVLILDRADEASQLSSQLYWGVPALGRVDLNQPWEMPSAYPAWQRALS